MWREPQKRIGVNVAVSESTIKRNVRITSRQRGVGMIEVLITLFILAVGLMGVASLQFISSLTNADALNRSQSVMVAQQLSERLRASAVMSQVGDGLVVNNEYFDSDNYNFENLSCPGGGQPYNCYCLNLPASIPDCGANQCSAAEFAVYDAYQTSCSAVAANPGVTVDLNCDDNDPGDTDACSTGSRHSIILAWPVENWQNIDRILNADCNEGRAEPHDCVIVDVTL